MFRPRALTVTERALLERLLSVDFPEAEYFRAQIPAITVVDACTCGCGTISFAVDLDRARRAPGRVWREGSHILVEGDARSWLMLVQYDGCLSELEHVPGYGPRPEDLDPEAVRPDLQVDPDWFDAG